MLDQESQARIFDGLVEGDMIEVGEPFAFAPDERLAWRCIAIEKDAAADTRYLFHVYFMGVIVKAARAVVKQGTEQVQWEAA